MKIGLHDANPIRLISRLWVFVGKFESNVERAAICVLGRGCYILLKTAEFPSQVAFSDFTQCETEIRGPCLKIYNSVV